MNKYLLILVSWLFIVAAEGATYPMPSRGEDIVGQIYSADVESGDTSTTIRQRYEISHDALLSANPQINFNKFHVGQEMIIPTEYVLPKYRNGIVVNTAELRLYYFTVDGRYVITYPVGLGRTSWRTPTTITKVINKKADPTWYVPDSIRGYMYEKTGEVLPDFIPPGPDNPLGKYALYLARRGYLIHGTNHPESVGTFASSGCMRMASDAIETLFNYVPVGTPVYIIHHPNKAGWRGNILYLESHPEVSGYEKPSELNDASPRDAVMIATQQQSAAVNWNVVQNIADHHNGIPTPIGEAL